MCELPTILSYKELIYFPDFVPVGRDNWRALSHSQFMTGDVIMFYRHHLFLRKDDWL